VSVRARLRAMPGLIEVAQGERLAALAAGVPEWASIVEIGSHTGLSTCWMAHHAAAHVFAVDPWGPPRPGSSDDPFGLGDRVYERFAGNITAEGLWPKVTPLAGRSVDVAAMWRAPVGLLFIDAVHTEAAVREDIDAWLPYLIDTGWLALHDYDTDPSHPYYGVSVVADALTASGAWDVAPLVGSLWTAHRR
jgi:MMP 1-O-methyltransferase